MQHLRNSKPYHSALGTPRFLFRLPKSHTRHLHINTGRLASASKTKRALLRPALNRETACVLYNRKGGQKRGEGGKRGSPREDKHPEFYRRLLVMMFGTHVNTCSSHRCGIPAAPFPDCKLGTRSNMPCVCRLHLKVCYINRDAQGGAKVHPRGRGKPKQVNTAHYIGRNSGNCDGQLEVGTAHQRGPEQRRQHALSSCTLR